ncbi:hypothetical protein O181_000399 [Austropuccinia psidii MF-1]|uniref:DNA-directed RNA polymerase III subunit RPC4 n=1 Tax=Austropuccinia psidii MF-1 TaxID=1389203 RepID=A0A9Q3B8H3_9BASI|nr:hypothetical protein [Austropuccinia psidii MF-1]
MEPSGSRARGRISRARGRGRGRAMESHNLDQPPLDPMLNELSDIPVTSTIQLSAPSFPPTTGEKPAIGSSSMAKFKPKMVKRVEKSETPVEGEISQGESFRGGRGRGRGAERGGRGRPEIVMTASGAFAMGPAEGGPRTGRFSQGPTRSGMRKIDNSVASADGKSKAGTASRSGTITPWNGAPEGIFELYSDPDDNASQSGEGKADDTDRITMADLNDITLEQPMAPVSLPWDPKRIAEREKMIQARNEKVAKLTRMKLKQEQDLDIKPHSLSTTPITISTPSRQSHSMSTGPESVVKREELEERESEAMKQDIKLKQEQREELTKVGKQLLRLAVTTPNSQQNVESSNETINGTSLYIFQFPRQFPKFKNPEIITPEQANEQTEQKVATGARPKTLKKKKPGPDDWMGWGKGGRRTECMGVPVGEETKTIEGQIGELVIRRSGRVQMLIGDVAYDVLPGAQPTFHQEVAVIDPKPDGKFRAMFVLGSTNQKFLVAPDVSSLLQRAQTEAPTGSLAQPC